METTMRTRASFLILAALASTACDRGTTTLETRTFRVEHMDAREAAELVDPYVYGSREGAEGAVSVVDGALTVRETRANLDEIERVLAEYDLPRPDIRLHFQLIEADGFTEQDARIADVREALDALFRFEGYRLAAETQLAMVEGTRASQPIAGTARPYALEAHLQSVRVREDGGSVTVSVRLASGVMDDGIATTLTVPLGETVVLGSARRAASEPTLILTVRPERVAS